MKRKKRGMYYTPTEYRRGRLSVVRGPKMSKKKYRGPRGSKLQK